jgi:hypothetical protein
MANGKDRVLIDFLAIPLPGTAIPIGLYRRYAGTSGHPTLALCLLIACLAIAWSIFLFNLNKKIHWSLLKKVVRAIRTRTARKVNSFVFLINRVSRTWLFYIHKLYHPSSRADPFDPQTETRKKEFVKSFRYKIAVEYLSSVIEFLEIKKSEFRKNRKSKPNERTECPAVIVTDFTTYGKIVRAMIDASLEYVDGENGKTIYCFTLLRLSPIEWFNLDRGTYCEESWNTYTNQMKEYVKGNRKLIIARHLMAIEKNKLNGYDQPSWADNGKVNAELNSWIWKKPADHPREGSKRARNSVRPLELSQRQELAHNLCSMGFHGIGRYIREKYPENKSAFVIIPNGIFDDSETNPGRSDTTGRNFHRGPREWTFHDNRKELGRFVNLGDEFKNAYQSPVPGDSGKRFLTVSTGPNDIDAIKGSESPFSILPDFFFISLINNSDFENLNNPEEFPLKKTQPLLCVQGAEYAKAIRLSFLDCNDTPRDLESLSEMIGGLLNSCKGSPQII